MEVFSERIGVKMKIKEIIVVEGKDDTVAIKKALDADTIETNGSAINFETLEKIKLAQKTRGVIVLTDPDFPGEKIRHTITKHVPQCKHAFIDKQFAIAKHGKGVGVEHASVEVIREALSHAYVMTEEAVSEVTQADLMDAGLIGGSDAKKRREELGKILKIGYANGKQLYKRLTMFQITKKDFLAAVAKMDKELGYE